MSYFSLRELCIYFIRAFIIRVNGIRVAYINVIVNRVLEIIRVCNEWVIFGLYGGVLVDNCGGGSGGGS